MTPRSWWSRLLGSVRREALDREMEQEMAFHLEMAARKEMSRGMDPGTARRTAQLAFGSVEAHKEAAREASRARVMENLGADVRFAVRSLRRSPSFTVAAVLTLALGIGASTAIFTVVNAVLLRPLPIPGPEQFRYVGWAWAENNHVPALTDFQYEFVRDNSRAFDAIAAYRTQEAYLGDGTAAEPLRGLRVTDGFFRAIGFVPRLGRPFAADDSREEGSASSIAILSDRVWRRSFGADSGIIGRQIHLDGEPRTVIGVLPPRFAFPPAVQYTDFLIPLAVHGDPAREGNNTDVIARLRDTPPAVHDADLRALTAAFAAAYPVLADNGQFRLYTYGEVHVGSALRRTLWVLLGAVSLVLLIACANTATLLLIRASARQGEIAVRASVGAGPMRITQQLLTEGLVLSLMAAGLGVLVSVAAVRAFTAVAPTALPVGSAVSLDARVLVFSIALSVVTGIAFGLVAAAPAYRTRLQSALLGSAGGRSMSAGHPRLREALVFVQATVAVVLLCGAALLVASFSRLIRVDPGFDAARVTTVRLGRLPPDYDPVRRDLLVERVLARVRALAGVERAALAPSLPLERGMNFPVDIPERPELGTGAVELRVVSPGYLATLGIPLRAGRDFDVHDVPGTEPVAIVNEAFARRFWGDVPPVGRPIRVGHINDRWVVGPGARHETRVIGVAADIHELGLDRPAKATVLIARAQASQGTPLLLVRGDPTTLVGAVRREVASEEPRLRPVVEQLSSVVHRSVSAPRFRTLLVGAFAGFAMLLAGIGVYGVTASTVQQRRRELGLRIALGATPVAVVIAVVRRCVVIVLAGTVVGLIVFAGTRRVLESWLYGIAPDDTGSIAIAVAVLALVALLACWLPARRAVRIDPATSLRLD